MTTVSKQKKFYYNKSPATAEVEEIVEKTKKTKKAKQMVIYHTAAGVILIRARREQMEKRQCSKGLFNTLSTIINENGNERQNSSHSPTLMQYTLCSFVCVN